MHGYVVHLLQIRTKNVTFEKLIKMVFKGKGIAAPAQTGLASNQQNQTQDEPVSTDAGNDKTAGKTAEKQGA